MRKLILVFLIFYPTLALAGNTAGWPYRFIKIFDRSTHIEIGLNLSCPFYGLSLSVSPNSIITQSGNHFEILLSLHNPGGIRCSPLPPELIDQGRTYFNLGQLQSGEYTLTVKYINDLPIPPDSNATVIEYPQFTFYVAHSIPSNNKYGLLLLMLIFLMLKSKYPKSRYRNAN